VLSDENWLKNALFTANNVILRFFFAQDQNIFKNFFWPKQKKKKMILNDYCQIAKFQGF
jgi:hypothetical protein